MRVVVLHTGYCDSGDTVIVEISALSYSYPDGTKALKDIRLKIEEKENVALVGANGSGKTTLLLTIMGALKGTGFIRILGESDLRKIRGRVGLVFQNPDDQLFMSTVFDDVAFGPLNLGLDDVSGRVHNALELVGLSGYEKRSSHHLSFGEKKRVAIATILSMEPELLLMDEPTENLDPRGKRQLLQLLKELSQPKIVATHDLGVASATCERIVVLNNGCIVTDGRTDKILSNAGLLEKHGF